MKTHMYYACVCTCIFVHSLHGQNKEFCSVLFWFKQPMYPCSADNTQALMHCINKQHSSRSSSKQLSQWYIFIFIYTYIFLFHLWHIFSNTYTQQIYNKETASHEMKRICWKLFSLLVTYPGRLNSNYRALDQIVWAPACFSKKLSGQYKHINLINV